jgi:transcriptional regulator with XRE-family HTH domain
MKTDFDLEKVEELASRGLTQAQIAEYFGVAGSTVCTHKKYPEFAQALDRGRAQGISEVANALFDKAVGGDTASMIFYLRSRAGWAEPQRAKPSAAQEARKVSELPTEELNALVAETLREWGDDEAKEHVDAFLMWWAQKMDEVHAFLREAFDDD